LGADWRGYRLERVQTVGGEFKKTLEKPLFSGVFCLGVL